jgi:hypothetical protein
MPYTLVPNILRGVISKKNVIIMLTAAKASNREVLLLLSIPAVHYKDVVDPVRWEGKTLRLAAYQIQWHYML